MLRRFFAHTLSLAVLVTACSSAPAATPTVAPTSVPVISPTTPLIVTATESKVDSTTTPATSPTDQPTTTPATDVPSASGPRTYVIQASDSSVSYAVGEIFINRNNRYNLAVGTTNIVQGEITLNSADPSQSQIGPITIDISQFQSDSSRRDNMIRENWLESAKFPLATFTPTQLEGLPTTYTPGAELTFKVTGDLLIRDTTRATTFTVTAQLQGDSLVGTADTVILMTDFNFSPPDIAGMLKAENEAKLTFKFVAKPE